MPTTTFAFASGIAPLPAYGQKTKIRFSPSTTWVAGDDWTIPFTSTLTGDFTLGKGNIAESSPTCSYKLRNRMYLGAGANFILSSVTDVTKWEEQDAGAAVISYRSQAGTQDSVVGLSSLQGRLAVFGNKSAQIWQVDADPNQLALLQVLDNTGTISALSVQNIGDYDVYYLDSTGVRSLRAKEVTLNAYVDDVGVPIDTLVRAALVGYDATLACGIVEPTTKQYWLFLNGNIYVLSRFPESKVLAWSIFLPTDSNAVSFTPTKFVVYNKQVYVRGSNDKVYQYGGTDNNTYDSSVVTVETSWLDMDEPSINKQGMGVDAVITGAWTVQCGMNPRGSLVTVIQRGSASAPSQTADSTYDIGHFPFSANGTHFKFKAVSANTGTKAKLGKLVLLYKTAQTK